MKEYSNPYAGAMLVHGKMRYAGAAGGVGHKRRILPGIDEAEHQALVEKFAMLRRTMERGRKKEQAVQQQKQMQDRLAAREHQFTTALC